MNSTGKAHFLIRADDMPWYSPAGHSGTKNIHLVSEALNSARFMEVILGEVDQGVGVSSHAHPGVEQAQYLLEGEA